MCGCKSSIFRIDYKAILSFFCKNLFGSSIIERKFALAFFALASLSALQLKYVCRCFVKLVCC